MPSQSAALNETDGPMIKNKGYAVFNPHNQPVDTLPVIYGFNNGGRPGWYDAVLIAENGKCLGGHLCSSEGFMFHDLGILEGARSDRHQAFRSHYPDGYRMDFVGYSELEGHAGLNAAIAKAQAGDPEQAA